MKLPFYYLIFAILATMVNIGFQDLSLRIYAAEYQVFISVVVGTIAGLIVKYILDKKYIFKYAVKDVLHDSQTFVLYTLMGVLTTIVFWGFEFGFEYIFHDKKMRYLGGIIGLSIGYYLKYRLDKRFVFV